MSYFLIDALMEKCEISIYLSDSFHKIYIKLRGMRHFQWKTRGNTKKIHE